MLPPLAILFVVVVNLAGHAQTNEQVIEIVLILKTFTNKNTVTACISTLKAHCP